jgi:hypothetical protein
MSRIHPDTIYATLAGVAISGAIGPLLFPTAAAIKTASLLSSIAAAGTLAYGEHSGAFNRARERYKIQRDSEREIFIQQAASREALALREIEVNELVETLVLLDELTPVEQRYFLGELGLLELLPIYQQPLLAVEPVQQTVEVPVVAKESEPEFSGVAQWATQDIEKFIEKAEAQANEPQTDTTFKEIDIGKAVAEMMVSGDVPLNVLLACPPRTGKTTLVTTTIAWLWKLTDGKATLQIRNGKENIDAATGKLKDDFLGLAYDPRFYQAVESNDDGAKFAAFYRGFTQTMRKPRAYPDVVICDEFNNIRAAAKRYDAENELKGANAKLTQIDNDTDLLVTQGTSRRKFCIYTSHSSYVCHIGLNRSYQDGLYTIVLGRGAAMDAIFKSLDGSMAIVRNKTLAKRLFADFQQWLNSPRRDKDKVVVLTNLITGNYDLYFAKYVDTSDLRFDVSSPGEHQPPVPPAPAAEDPYAMWDEEFEGKTGHQPEDDPNWQPQSQPKQPSRKELFDALATWINQLGKTPNDDELRNKAAELALVQPEALSNDALVGIKWILSQEYGVKFDS